MTTTPPPAFSRPAHSANTGPEQLLEFTGISISVATLFAAVAIGLFCTVLPRSGAGDTAGQAPVTKSAPEIATRLADNAAVEPAQLNDDPPRAPAASAPTRNERNAPPTSRNLQLLTEFLARKYRVSREETQGLVQTAFDQGRRFGVDPLLIIAVMAIESSFNPIAESVAGAKGLMQIIPRYHPEKFSADTVADDAVLDPAVNIQVGTRILKEYIRRAGSLEAGLQMYNGAASDTGNAYAAKVLGEKQRLLQVIGHAGTGA